MRWWMAILGGLNGFVGGAAFGNYVSPRLAGLFILVVSALQTGTAIYKSASKPDKEVLEQ